MNKAKPYNGKVVLFIYVACPRCKERIPHEEFDEHFEHCRGSSIDQELEQLIISV